MGNGWTPERRAKQAKLIKNWQPWKSSTGPVTVEGKIKASRNAWKGGQRAKERQGLKKVAAIMAMLKGRRGAGGRRLSPKGWKW